MNYNTKKTALLVSAPGIVREATTVMLDSLPRVAGVELASGALSAIEQLRKGNSYLLVIDANLPPEEVESLVRWVKEQRSDTRCIVLAKSMVELEQARVAGADAVFLRSISARQLEEALWPRDQEQETNA
jgi:DNA-binding NarL/FixJ family response regulator